MAALARGRPWLPLLVVLTASGAARGWQPQEKILLREVQALTLYSGQYTSYRRTSPIPQLQCTGGSAGCVAHTPEVVQCYNKGWDGYDVQWECKAQMDHSYRFGKIEVSCEGYEYPDDPYVLKGSCGLQYTLELNKNGQHKASYFDSHHSATTHDSIASGSGLVLVVLFVVLVYGVYKLFLCDNRPQQGFSYGDGPSETYRPNHQNPPPPGFKSTFTGAASGLSSDSNSGPGFWTGLGAGGLLGYLAGSRRSPSYSPYYNTWTGPTAPPPPVFGPSSGFSAPSSGSRSTSGFGGTKRR